MLAEEAVDFIHICNINLSYGHDPLFRDLSLHLPLGQWSCLLGRSGVGKSSLLRLIAGLIPQYDIKGTNACTQSLTLERGNIKNFRQRISYMAQTDSLLPWLNVLDNACLNTKLKGSKPKAVKAQAEDLLARLGLSHAHSLFPHQLSGGMRQRVALVRTMLENKEIILMDEPFSALDAISKYQLHSLAVDLFAGQTVLFITHDPAEALRLSHHIYLMHDQPVILKKIKSLSSKIPRDLYDQELMLAHQSIIKEMAASDGPHE